MVSKQFVYIHIYTVKKGKAFRDPQWVLAFLSAPFQPQSNHWLSHSFISAHFKVHLASIVNASQIHLQIAKSLLLHLHPNIIPYPNHHRIQSKVHIFDLLIALLISFILDLSQLSHSSFCSHRIPVHFIASNRSVL